ncbi:PilW family protein [Oceanisphaera pacifica]|uniref:Type II secretion system protein n=1 Tax=Oceanisphaera pacifica TaxID=2818389 RepID=A0ABS3NDV5_9GAMM|nr:type II secretion system protein [Oceanisphaera pacifica]MBO1518767.1 type II secretion system protein [Oceanisphaera pacifica]
MSLFINSATSAPISKQRGFTLIELVIAMTIMAVVSVFSIKFITNSVGIYQQGKDREQLMSDVRFGIERLNREVRNAVPGSLRIEDIAGNKKGTDACVRFWPIDTARRYTDIEPGTPSTKDNVIIPARPDELDESGHRTDKLEYYPSSWMIISPIGLDSRDQVCLDAPADTACAVQIIAEPIPANGTDLEFSVDKISRSSNQRVFFAKDQVRYCITAEKKLTRANGLIGESFDQPVLMAEHISKGDFSEGSNTGEDADLYSQLTFNLTASNNNEHISFSHKIRLYNAP